MKAVHSGRLLRREMQPRTLSANALALALRVSSGRVTDVLNEKRGVSLETAMRLGRYFGNSARFWLNLQTTYELRSRRGGAWRTDRGRGRARDRMRSAGGDADQSKMARGRGVSCSARAPSGRASRSGSGGVPSGLASSAATGRPGCRC